MWQELSYPWQRTLELAWESYREGSLPIAAVLVDTQGRIVASGRNRTREASFTNRKMAHAEMDLMLQLVYDEHPDIRRYSFYTSMEPCPMCMGSIVMTDVRRVYMAVRDPWAGCSNMLQLPYVASKKMEVAFVGGSVERAAALLYAHKELEILQERIPEFIQCFQECYPLEFAAAAKLLTAGDLKRLAASGSEMSKVFDLLLQC